MPRTSQLALAACLALASRQADAFTITVAHEALTTPTRGNALSPVSTRCCPTPALVRRRSPLFLSSVADPESKSSTLKELPESAVELTLRIPATATAAAYDKTLSEVAKKVSIPGFRKGAKIPPQVIEQAWSKQGGRQALRTMAINELCGELIETALKKEHGLEPLGQPTLVMPAEELAEGFVPGQELEVAVKCDVWPEIRWKQVEGKEKPYLGLTGTYKRKPFNQERFDMALNDLKERYVKLEPHADQTQSLAMGDACKVNMVGYMATAEGGKGEPLPDAASGDGVEVVLGPGLYMEGLVEGLEGGKVGDTKTVNVRFPDVSHVITWEEKNALMRVAVFSVQRNNPKFLRFADIAPQK